MEATFSYVFVNATKIHQLKAKDSEINPYPFFWVIFWKILKSVIWKKKTRLKRL